MNCPARDGRDAMIADMDDGGVIRKEGKEKGPNIPKSCLESSPGVVTAENASPEHKSRNVENLYWTLVKTARYVDLFWKARTYSKEHCQDLEGGLKKVNNSLSTEVIDVFTRRLLKEKGEPKTS
ncbi:hypothetical protein J6590_035094 [Homalodisca vitripennis]|nr:hypothetical protein J6590_035094 [Homalodisca vitripennis]